MALGFAFVGLQFEIFGRVRDVTILSKNFEMGEKVISYHCALRCISFGKD